MSIFSEICTWFFVGLLGFFYLFTTMLT